MLWIDFGRGDSTTQVQHWENGEDCWDLANIQRWRRNGRSSGTVSSVIYANISEPLQIYTRRNVSLFYCHLFKQTTIDVLQEQCNTTSATNSHVVLQLEHAQSLLLQFSEGLAEVSPWLEETQTLIGQLTLSTISYEAFREQQDLLQVDETCLDSQLCQLFFLVLFNKEVLLCFTVCNHFPNGLMDCFVQA